jgi:hypothetical protein
LGAPSIGPHSVSQVVRRLVPDGTRSDLTLNCKELIMLFSKSATNRPAAAPFAIPALARCRLNAAAIDARDAVFADRRVDSAVLDFLAQVNKSADATRWQAERAATELAIQASGPDAERVLQQLHLWTEEIKRQHSTFEAAFADFDAQHRALVAARAPLRAAVAARCSKLHSEIALVNRERENLNCSGRCELPPIGLRAAALDVLTVDERAAVLAVQRAPSPLPTHEELNKRGFELVRQIEPLEAFLADGDVKHLQGLGFDAAVQARLKAEGAA